MDTFTQIALGATVAEVGFRKRLGGRATIFGGFCGLVPDLDVALGFFDPWADLIYHRSFSHSLFVLILVTPIFGWLGKHFGRKGTLGQWSHLAWWALITHPLLDVFTTYGTQFFWPLTDWRVALDGASIVDPIYTLPLVIVLLFALRKGEPTPRRARASALVLTLTTLYLFLGVGFMSYAKARASAALEGRGFQAEDLRAMPAMGTNLLFRVVAKRGEERRVGYVSLLDDSPVRFACATSLRSDSADALLERDRGTMFRWFSGDWLLLRESDDGIEVLDLRFGTPHTPFSTLFAIHAERSGDGYGPFERMPRSSDGFGAGLASIWDAMLHGWAGEDCDESGAP